MRKKFIHTANNDSKPLRRWLLGIICLLGWQGVIANDSEPYTPAIDIEVTAAELLTVSSSTAPNDDVLFMTFEVGEEYLFYPPPSESFFLYVGQFRGYPSDILPIWLEEKQRFQLTDIFYNWEQFEENAPIIFTKLWGDNLTPEAQQEFTTSKTPHFSHSMVVDKRGRILRGIIAYFMKGRKTSLAFYPLPNATLKINSGNLSLEVTTNKRGKFSLYEDEGLYLEEGEEYQVEVFVDDVVVLSKIITRENSKYPEWFLVPEHSNFSEMTGYVHDTAGAPLAGVTLTAGTHTTTTDENGYYQLKHLVIGATYTLEASKEGYNFGPVEFTVGEGQPVTIDLVEKKSTQCLLYAVHDTARDRGRLRTVNLAEDIEIKGLPFKPRARQMSLAVADFDGDSKDEIAMAAKTGGHTITLAEFNGLTLRTITTPMNGMLLATGDLDGDEQPEIVAASRSANRHSVQSYAPNGDTLETIKLFEDNTRMAPAVGDVDGDGKDDIIAGSLLKADQVVVYNSATQQRQTFSVFQEQESRLRKKLQSPGKAKGCDKKSQGNRCDNEVPREPAPTEPAPSQDSGPSPVTPKAETTESEKTSSPVTPKTETTENDSSVSAKTSPTTETADSGETEVAPTPVREDSVSASTEPTENGETEVAPTTDDKKPAKKRDSTSGKPKPASSQANKKPTHGVQVAAGDFDGDGKDEIVAAQASKGSRVEIYQSDGTLQNAFEAFESQKGVVITVGNVIGDEAPEILVGEAKGNLIRGFSVNGEQLFEFEAVEEGNVSSLAVFGCLE